MSILNETLLQDLCAMSINDLTALMQTIATIRDLKQRIVSPAQPGDSRPSPEPSVPRSSGPPPSLGELVHQTLARKSPQRRSDIIAAVAEAAGRPVTESLKSKVGDILNQPKNTHIRKIGYGIYSLAQGAE